MFAGIDARVVPVAVDGESGIEHGMEPAALLAAVAAHPEAKAIVVVSPTVYGATSDIAALAEIAHAHRIPLIVDAAWGAAFPFSRHLPEAATASGADVMVCSLHKTLGALAQGSIMVVRGDLVDKAALRDGLRDVPEHESLRSDSCQHRCDAARSCRAGRASVAPDGRARANHARARLARIDGITVYGRELVGRFGIHDVDETKVTIDVKRLGLTGFQADEWLQRERRVSVVLSDLDSIVASFGTGTTARDVRRLVAAVQDLAKHARDGNAQFFRPATTPPGYDGLSFEQAIARAAGVLRRDGRHRDRGRRRPLGGGGRRAGSSGDAAASAGAADHRSARGLSRSAPRLRDVSAGSERPWHGHDSCGPYGRFLAGMV